MRWYTRALRIPRLIGKLPSGERIKGGPYRPGQAVACVVTAVLLQKTMRWWGGLFDGPFAYLQAWGVLIAVSVAMLFAARRIPTSTVNPLIAVGGAARLAVGGGGVRRGGRAVRLPAPRGGEQVRVTVCAVLPVGGQPWPEAPTAAVAPSTEREPARGAGGTGVAPEDHRLGARPGRPGPGGLTHALWGVPVVRRHRTRRPPQHLRRLLRNGRPGRVAPTPEAPAGAGTGSTAEKLAARLAGRAA
jgi:hypothetical protein